MVNLRTAIAVLLLAASLLCRAGERERIEILLPIGSRQKAALGSGKGFQVTSARVDWWAIPKPKLPPVEAAMAESPIVVVLDFLHTPDEKPECLVEELLPVLEDPAYRGRLRVLALGGPKPYFHTLRGRYRTFQILDVQQVRAERIRNACKVAPKLQPSAQRQPKADFWKRLANAPGYGTSQLLANWSQFDGTKSGIREVIAEIPAKGAPARIFWLAEDFRPFDGPPNGCDINEDESRTGILIGGNCPSGGLVDRALLYFFLSEITHAGAVITPVVMAHGNTGETGMREHSREAAARMARYTGAPVVLADQHPSRSLIAAIQQSDRWPVASLAVPVVGMRAVVTQPRKLSVALSDGTRVERRFATKEGQVMVDNLMEEVREARRMARYAGSNPIPMGAAIPMAPSAMNRATMFAAHGSANPQPMWMLPRRLNVQVKSGCGDLPARTPGDHAVLTIKVPEPDWAGHGPVEVVLRGERALAQSLTATRQELQAGVCFGVPAAEAADGFELLIVDPEAGAGGLFSAKSPGN